MENWNLMLPQIPLAIHRRKTILFTIKILEFWNADFSPIVSIFRTNKFIKWLNFQPSLSVRSGIEK